MIGLGLRLVRAGILDICFETGRFIGSFLAGVDESLSRG